MLGVTMEESGVSKLIAIKLDNDIELLKQEKAEEDADTFIEEDVEPEEGIYIPSRPPKRIHKTQEEQPDEHHGNDSDA